MNDDNFINTMIFSFKRVFLFSLIADCAWFESNGKNNETEQSVKYLQILLTRIIIYDLLEFVPGIVNHAVAMFDLTLDLSTKRLR